MQTSNSKLRFNGDGVALKGQEPILPSAAPESTDFHGSGLVPRDVQDLALAACPHLDSVVAVELSPLLLWAAIVDVESLALEPLCAGRPEVVPLPQVLEQTLSLLSDL